MNEKGCPNRPSLHVVQDALPLEVIHWAATAIAADSDVHYTLGYLASEENWIKTSSPGVQFLLP